MTNIAVEEFDVECFKIPNNFIQEKPNVLVSRLQVRDYEYLAIYRLTIFRTKRSWYLRLGTITKQKHVRSVISNNFCSTYSLGQDLGILWSQLGGVIETEFFLHSSNDLGIPVLGYEHNILYDLDSEYFNVKIHSGQDDVRLIPLLHPIYGTSQDVLNKLIG